MFKPWRHLLASGIGFGVGHMMHKYETTIEEPVQNYDRG